MRVRLKDVAAKANVAVNTASTILNRRPNSWASKETAERVFKAAEELGYRPNRAALGLRIGRFHAIGLLIADINNPFYTTFAHHLSLEAERHGYDVVIESWRSDLQREKVCLEEIMNRQLDGVVAFLSDRQVHQDYLNRQFTSGTPFVIFGSSVGDQVPVDCVISDFEVGLRQAVTRLLELGHRHFMFLSALAEGQTDGHRNRLFAQLMAEKAGMGVRYEVLRSGPAIEDAYGVARERLTAGERPTAIVALNDLAAIAAIRAAGDQGLRVPQDISVLGVDDIPMGVFLPAKLSTIAQPLEGMAKKAWELVFSRINSGKDLGGPRQEVFLTQFRERETTGRCAGEGQ